MLQSVLVETKVNFGSMKCIFLNGCNSKIYTKFFLILLLLYVLSFAVLKKGCAVNASGLAVRHDGASVLAVPVAVYFELT